MGRPSGTKNVMRTPEEKEKLVKDFFNSKLGYRSFAREHDIYPSLFIKWIHNYRENGIDGLKYKKDVKGNRGKYNRHKTEVEKLKEELLKKEIELMRLKKGYVVKGVGAKKEYVSISDVNIK